MNVIYWSKNQADNLLNHTVFLSSYRDHFIHRRKISNQNWTKKLKIPQILIFSSIRINKKGCMKILKTTYDIMILKICDTNTKRFYRIWNVIKFSICGLWFIAVASFDHCSPRLLQIMTTYKIKQTIFFSIVKKSVAFNWV
jgi:hypothetical protein